MPVLIFDYTCQNENASAIQLAAVFCTFVLCEKKPEQTDKLTISSHMFNCVFCRHLLDHWFKIRASD